MKNDNDILSVYRSNNLDKLLSNLKVIRNVELAIELGKFVSYEDNPDIFDISNTKLNSIGQKIYDLYKCDKVNFNKDTWLQYKSSIGNIIDKYDKFKVSKENYTLSVCDIEMGNKNMDEFIFDDNFAGLSPKSSLCNFVIDDLTYPNISSYLAVKIMGFHNKDYNNDLKYYNNISTKKLNGSEVDFLNVNNISKLVSKNYKEKYRERLLNSLVKVLNHKFTTNTSALNRLLSTNDNKLIWRSKDTILGLDINDNGENLMGIYLERLRNKLLPSHYGKLRLTNISNSNTIRNSNVYNSCVKHFIYQINMFYKFADIFCLDINNIDICYVMKNFLILFFNQNNICLLNNLNKQYEPPNFFCNDINNNDSICIINKITDNNILKWLWNSILYIYTSNKNTSETCTIVNVKNEIGKYLYETYKTIYYFLNVCINTHTIILPLHQETVVKYIEVLLNIKLDGTEEENIDYGIMYNVLNIEFFDKIEYELGICLSDIIKNKYTCLGIKIIEFERWAQILYSKIYQLK